MANPARDLEYRVTAVRPRSLAPLKEVREKMKYLDHHSIDIFFEQIALEPLALDRIVIGTTDSLT